MERWNARGSIETVRNDGDVLIMSNLFRDQRTLFRCYKKLKMMMMKRSRSTRRRRMMMTVIMMMITMKKKRMMRMSSVRNSIGSSGPERISRGEKQCWLTDNQLVSKLLERTRKNCLTSKMVMTRGNDRHDKNKLTYRSRESQTVLLGEAGNDITVQWLSKSKNTIFDEFPSFLLLDDFTKLKNYYLHTKF